MKSKRDVLFLCQYFYPEYVSSATLPFDTAEALTKAGYSVGALAGYPNEYNLADGVPLREVHNGVEIKRLKYIQLKRTNKLGRLINYFSFTLSVALRFNEFRKYKAVIVYSNPPVLPLIAAVAKMVFGVKVVFVSYDIYPEMAQITNTISKDSLISKMMKAVNKIVFKHVNKVVALSSEMKSYLIENRKSLSKQDVEVIPNWYEDKGTSNRSGSKENELFKSIKNNKLIVSYFGNMGICQDLDTIVDAIRELKNDNEVHFLFAGHGNKMESLKAIVETEGLKNVTVFDFLHGQDFQDALSISDTFIVSLADGLTGLAVPSKTYSYMMASKPVIAIMHPDSDISKDLTENNAGFAIEVGQSFELVKSIYEIKEDSDKRNLMGKNCREVFLAKYTKECGTSKYVDMIKRTLEA